MMNQENRYLLKLAWKNISRHKGRSFFIGFSVAMSVCIAVWVMAFFDGLNYQIENAVVQTNTGRFQLQETNFFQTTDSETPLVFDAKTASLLDNEDKIISYSPELLLDGNISTPEGAAALSVLGITPKFHSKFISVSENMISGQYLTEADNGIIIGEDLAKTFKFGIGDQLVLNFQDVKGELRSELLPITGIYKYSSKSFEKRFVYISQQKWQTLFFGKLRSPILFHRIDIMTPNLSAKPQIESIAQSLKLKLQSWRDINPEMAVVIDFHDGMINFFFVIIAVTITMTILTPVRMLWQERMKEMKMMTVLGIPHKGLWKLGLFEVMWMILLAGTGATIILTIIISIQSYSGIDFSFLNNGIAVERAGIELPSIVYPRATIQQVCMTFSFVLLTMLLSYTWSIGRTLKRLESAL